LPNSELDATVARAGRYPYLFLAAGFFAEDAFGLDSAAPPSRPNSSGTVVLASSKPR
jgi:hypothetical protein